MAVNYRNKDGNIIGTDQSLLDNATFDWTTIQERLFQYTDPVLLNLTDIGGTADDKFTYGSTSHGFGVCVFQNKLYVGTYNTIGATDSTGAKLLVYDGSSWSVIIKATIGAAAGDVALIPSAVYDGKLWLGSANAAGSVSVFSFDGTTWTAYAAATTGTVAADTYIYPLAVYDSKLYFGTSNTTAATDSTAAKIITYDGAAWATVTKATMGGVNADTALDKACLYNGKIYIATINTTSNTDSSAAKILSYDGAVWSVITKATMGGTNGDRAFGYMAVWNNRMYIGTYNISVAATDSTAAKIIIYNGSSWTINTKAVMGLVNDDYGFLGMAVYNGRLYTATYNDVAATNNTSSKLVVVRYSADTSDNWCRFYKSYFGGATNDQHIMLMAVYDNKLFVCIRNATAGAGKIAIFQIPIIECLNSYTTRGF